MHPPRGDFAVCECSVIRTRQPRCRRESWAMGWSLDGEHNCIQWIYDCIHIQTHKHKHVCVCAAKGLPMCCRESWTMGWSLDVEHNCIQWMNNSYAYKHKHTQTCVCVCVCTVCMCLEMVWVIIDYINMCTHRTHTPCVCVCMSMLLHTEPWYGAGLRL